jgi:hypothetical protein
VLRELERKRLFRTYRPAATSTKGGRVAGDEQIRSALLYEENVEESFAKKGVPWWRWRRAVATYLEHKYLIRGIEFLVVLFFLLAAVYAWCAPLAARK